MIGMPKRAIAAMSAVIERGSGALSRATCCALLVVCCACQSGEQQQRTRADQLRNESAALFGTGGAGNTRTRSDSKVDADWSIVVAVFRGEAQTEAARIAHRRMQTEGRLPEAFIERRGPATVIAYGHYTGPEDAAALRDLERIQEMDFNGLRPYRIAYLAPPYAGVVVGSRPEHNLLSAKALFPNALYTLEIGKYERTDVARPTEEQLEEVRRKAEEAAAILRQEGELAFYYHGPWRSMVTVGVFDQTDFDPRYPGMESARLREARQRHPYRLLNGKGVRTRIKGTAEWRMVESALVNIPSR